MLSKSKFKLFILALLFSTVAYAQQENKTQFSLEIDPATFAFGGYSFHFRVNPSGTEHLLMGVGAYAMNMPDALVNLNSKNKNGGWEVRINQGYGVFTEYHFKEINRKWFVGTQVSIQEYKIKNEFQEGTSKYNNLLIMPYMGYTWRLNSGLYFKPWVGLGYTKQISGNNQVGTAMYDVAPLVPFATLHVGYQF